MVMTRCKGTVVSLTALITLTLMTPALCAAPSPVNATLQLPAFTSIRSCLPFTFLVQPPGPNAITVSTATINADANAISATVLTVDNDGVLVLTVSQGFRTKNPIKLTIIPATTSSLNYLENNGPGDLILGPGSNAPSLSVVATGNANLLGYDVSASGVEATSTGSGIVMLDGSFGSGSITTSGTGKTYLVGSVAGLVQVDASGISSVFVESAPSAVLDGTVQGLSKVLFTEGICNVQPQFASLNVFGNPCQQVSRPRDLGFHPVWTCGLVVDGFSTCAVPTGDMPPPAIPAIPWLHTDGTPFPKSPLPKRAATRNAAPGTSTSQTFFNPNGNDVFSGSSGDGSNSFSSSSNSGGGGGSSMTSTSRNGGPAVVTINGQVVSPDESASQDQGQGPQQNAEGLAIASIRCAERRPTQVLGR